MIETDSVGETVSDRKPEKYLLGRVLFESSAGGPLGLRKRLVLNETMSLVARFRSISEFSFKPV